MVLHEAAAAPLAGVEVPTTGRVVVVVGPEGGLTDDEVGALAEAGAVPVRLGEVIGRSIRRTLDARHTQVA